MMKLRILLLALAGTHTPQVYAEGFDCLIEPLKTVEIRSPVSGLIERVHVSRGDVVKEGMTLVTLESSIERSAADLSKFKSEAVGSVMSGENRVAYADRTFGRKQNMAQQKLISMQDHDEAEVEFKVAESDLLVAKENKQLAKLEHRHAVNQLNLRVLRSNVSGVVTDQLLNAGEMVSVTESSKPVLKIAQLDVLKVDAIIPVSMYGRIKVGGKAQIQPEAPIKGSFAGTVQVVDKVIDAASGTFGVRMLLSNPNFALPGGIRCKATFAGLDIAAAENGKKSFTAASPTSSSTAPKPLPNTEKIIAAPNNKRANN